MNTASEQLQARLMQLLHVESLSPTHRRIGQWILNHPSESIFLSSVELAKRADVSQASVIRFAVATGFDGYPQLQRHLREVVGALPTDLGEPTEGNRYQRAVAEEQRNLERLSSDLVDDALISQLGAELAAAHGLISIGLRHSSALATYFGYLAAKIHPSVRMVTDGGSAVLERILHARRDKAEWIVCFALPRYPSELCDLLGFAREIGFKVVTVSDRHVLPLVELSDTLLSVPLGTQLVFDVPVAPLMLAGLLLDAMREAKPRRTQDRLDAEEQLAVEIGAFL